MTVGMILDTTFRAYSQNVLLMLGITALAYLPYFVLWLLGLVLIIDHIPAATDVSFWIFQALAGVFYLVAYPFATAAATYAIGERYLHKPASAVDAMKAAWKRYKTLLWGVTITGLIVGMGFLLLIVPGILWAVSYALLFPVIMLESKSAKDSRQRSWALVAGNRGKVFFIMLIFGILSMVVTTGLQKILPMFLEADALP